MMAFYPVLLELKNSRCLVVGGGAVATRKVRSLLQAGAAVTVLAPELGEELQGLVTTGSVQYLRDSYRKDYYRDEGWREFSLVIAATDSMTINREIYAAARAARVLVNVVDDPEYSDFIAPALLRRGDLLLAVSTSGKIPYLAKELRKYLEGKFYPGLAEELLQLQGLRAEIIRAAQGNEALKRGRFERELKPRIQELIRKLD